MRISNRLLATTLLASTFVMAEPALAGVLTVASTGANYTQIQAAVNAAAPDDVILISPGPYNAVTIDGKSLTLLSKAGNVSILGTTTVKNLAASQRVVLAGLRGYGTTTAQTSPDSGAGLYVVNNAGHVRIESCSFFGAVGWGDGLSGMFCCDMPASARGRDGALVINNAQGVAFTATELRGGRGAIPNTNPFACYCGSSQAGGDGLRVQSTLVSLYDCVTMGESGGDNATLGGAGGAGCRTIAGAALTGIFASGSIFRGGKGGDAWDYFFGTVGGAGGTGLLVGASTGAHLLDNTYFAGTGGNSNYGSFPPGAPGTQLSGSGSIFTDPETRIVMTTDRFARAGSVVKVRVQGTPGQLIHLLVSRTPTFMILPSWRGTLVSFPGKGSVEVPLGTIPASGVLQTRYQVPPIPGGATSATVFIQAYRFDSTLGPKLAAGTTITLLH